MLRVMIPDRGELVLSHAVFDWNGTLAVDGRLLPDIGAAMAELSTVVACHVLTAATHGVPEEVETVLGLTPHLVRDGREKARYVAALPGGVAAVGNGANDRAMLELAELGIAVVGREGMAAELARVADVVVPDPLAAIELLLHPRRLMATLRP
jgi:soluble P-type ATPase